MVKIVNLFLIEIKNAWRYKIEVITWLMGTFSISIPAFSIILLGDLNNTILPNGDAISYLVFLLISMGYWGFMENFWDTIFELRRKMREGILETTLLLPLKTYHLLVGWAMKGMITTILHSFPVLLFVVVYYAYSLSFTQLLFLLVIFLVSILANYGLCLILVGVALIWKEADQVISIVANIAPFVCGLYIPIAMLPTVFLPLTFMFPFSWALDILRTIIFHTASILPMQTECFVFAAVSCIYVVAGTMVYSCLMMKAKKEGLSKF